MPLGWLLQITIHKNLMQTYIYRVCIIVPAVVEVGSGNVVVISSSSSSSRRSCVASIRGRSMMYDGLFLCNCSVEHTVQVVN
jgi:hypothetical protein